MSITRAEQLEHLSHITLAEAPVVILGSIGHAALMGNPLPPLIKRNRQVRDIDIHAINSMSKIEVESSLHSSDLDAPAPLDAGLNTLLRRESNGVYAVKGEVAVELHHSGILEEFREYPVQEENGLMLRSFGELGMLAAHTVEPTKRLLFHRASDQKFIEWFSDQGLRLPRGLEQSIASFHKACQEKYPYAAILRHTSKAYTHVMPEVVRSRLRHITHNFMLHHAGRRTPTTDQLNTKPPESM